MRPFSKCSLVNNRIERLKESLNKQLKYDIVKVLNETASVLDPRGQESPDGKNIFDMINYIKDQCLISSQNGINKGRIDVGSFLKNIGWIESLDIEYVFGDFESIFAGIDLKSIQIQESPKSIKYARIVLHLNHDYNEIFQHLGPILRHEFFHLFQIKTYRTFSQGFENEDLKMRYGSSETLNQYRHNLYPHLVKNTKDNVYYPEDNEHIAKEDRVAYYILELIYCLNPMEMQAFIQQKYETMAFSFEIYLKEVIEKADDIQNVIYYNDFIKSISARFIKNPELFLNSLYEETKEYFSKDNKELQNAILDRCKAELIASKNFPNGTATFFFRLYRTFKRQLEHFERKISKMNTVFFDKQFKLLKDTIYKENAALRFSQNESYASVCLVPIENLLYSDPILYESYSLVRESLKRENDYIESLGNRILPTWNPDYSKIQYSPI